MQTRSDRTRRWSVILSAVAAVVAVVVVLLISFADYGASAHTVTASAQSEEGPGLAEALERAIDAKASGRS